MRTLSLCTGVGGLDLAVELVTAIDLVGVADPDPDAVRVLAHQFPDVPNYGDIKAIDWSVFACAGIELVTAGYPCQPFSLAGRREGTDDPRHLYPYISKAVRSLRPRFVFLENVAGHRSKGFGYVLEDLSTSGYRVAWTSVRASDVGVPHRRERVFILAALPDAESIGRRQGGSERTREQWGSDDGFRGEPTSPDSEVFGWTAGSSNPGRTREELSRPSRSGDHTLSWREYSGSIERWERITGRPAPYPVARGPRGGCRVSAEFGE